MSFIENALTESRLESRPESGLRLESQLESRLESRLESKLVARLAVIIRKMPMGKSDMAAQLGQQPLAQAEKDSI